MGPGKLRAKKFNKKANKYENNRYNNAKSNNIRMHTRGEHKQMFCVECQKVVSGDPVLGDAVYGVGSKFSTIRLWRCPHCKNYAGISTDIIPNPQIRKIRRQIHSMIDVLWMDGCVSRGWVYREMSDILGYNFHNGSIASVDEAVRAYDAAVKLINRYKIKKLEDYNNRKRGKVR